MSSIDKSDLDRLKQRIAGLPVDRVINIFFEIWGDERDRAEKAERELEAARAKMRELIVVAFNHTINANGGVGNGDRAGLRMRQALEESLARESPAWATDDKHVPLAAYDAAREGK